MNERRREKNIAVVTSYLKDSFPGDEVLDDDDFEHDCRYYRITRGTSLAHRVRVAREFLDDHSADEIVARLRAWDAASVIRSAGARFVLISESGIEVHPS